MNKKPKDFDPAASGNPFRDISEAEVDLMNRQAERIKNGEWSDESDCIQSIHNQLYPRDTIENEDEIRAVFADKIQWVDFPVDALPAAAASYTRAMAAALNCNEAYIAVPMLAVLGAAVGNSYRLRCKHTWIEPSTLWTLLLGRSGTMKSPAIHAATFPVLDLEKKASLEFETDREIYERDLEIYNNLSKQERANAARPAKPTRRRYRIHDATIEAVGVLHSENPRGLLLAHDELAGWIGSFDRYANGQSDVQSWIGMYEGKYVQVDRKGGDHKTVDVHFPSVCVCGTMQPAIFSDKLTPAHFESGFAARLLIAHPPEQPRFWTDADVTDDVRESYARLIVLLYDFPYIGEYPQTISFSRFSQPLFIEYVNENARVINSLPEGPMRSAVSKIEAVAARLALIFHMADQMGEETFIDQVSADATRRAIEVARWFRREISRIHQRESFEERTLSRDEKNLRELPDEFTWKEVTKTWNVTRTAAYKVIKRMILKGYVEDARHGVFRKYPRDTVDFGYNGYTSEDTKNIMSPKDTRDIGDIGDSAE